MSHVPQLYERQVVVGQADGFNLSVCCDDTWRHPDESYAPRCIHFLAYKQSDSCEVERYAELPEIYVADGKIEICIYCEFARLNSLGHLQFGLTKILTHARKARMRDGGLSMRRLIEEMQTLHDAEIKPLECNWVKPAKNKQE